MENNSQTPYSHLDPTMILDAVESLGFRCTGYLFALNSYENRVYQVGIEESAPMIVKFYRPNRWSDETILEEHQFSLELVEHEIPIVSPWVKENLSLHRFQDYRFALFPRFAGRALELSSLDQLEWMGRFIGRLHAIGAAHPFLHRPQLTVDTYGVTPYELLIERKFIPDYLKENYQNTVEAILKKIKQYFKTFASQNYIRLHGDIHAGNVLWNDAGPHIVDLDDCMMGPAMQDIWMLLSGNKDQMEIELEHILKGYRLFHDFNTQELNLIEALRSLRMLHYSAWLAKRWDDPAFPLSFPWFNTPNYWQKQLADLREQNALLD